MPNIVRVFLCFFVFINFAQAQRYDRSTRNYLEFQHKPYYFGITLGYNNTSFNIARGKNFALNDSISGVTSPGSSAFNLGIVGNLKLGQYFDLRLLPTLCFSSRSLEFTGLYSRSTITKSAESVMIELPLQVRYKSALYHDTRLFVLAGVKYSMDLAANSRQRNQVNAVKLAPTDFAFEWGVGFQIFFPYFIFTPEIKFSYGLGNALLYEKNLIYTNTLEKVFTRAVTISFHFEG